MKLKSKLLLALLASTSATFVCAEEAADPLTFNVGAVSQYRYRGIAQTHGDAALQGGLDYAHSSGLYVGAWGSTIKWIKDNSQTANKVEGPVEIDLYGGYKFEAAGLAYDVGYLRYQYQGNSLEKIANGTYANANTDEVYAAVTAGVFTAKYSYSLGNLFGNLNSKGSQYIDLSATIDMGNGYSLVPHVGRQSISNNTNGSYTDFALTLNKDFGKGLSGSLSAIATTAHGGPGEFYRSPYKGYDMGKNALVAGVKYTF